MNFDEENPRIEEVEEVEEDEEDEEDELYVDLGMFSQAVVWGTDWTTETIYSQLKKGNIDLNPSFQRRDAWTDKEKSKLIESLMLGLPVPQIILAENKNKKNSYLIIDGKQRLLSIRRFYSEEAGCNDENSFKTLKLTGLTILSRLNGYSYEKIKEMYPEFITSMENQSIRTIVIKNWPDEEFLYMVFLRLNTGSKKLSPQELRQALKPGPFLTYLDNVTAGSEIMQKMLKNKSADSRMKDVELALRYFSYKYFITEYKGNLKEFFDKTCETLNKSWNNEENKIINSYMQLEEAIKFTNDIFRTKNPFSRYTNQVSHNRFHKSIFEIFTYYFSEENVRELIGRNRETFVEKFKELNDNPEFADSVNDTTKDINKVVKRFNYFADLLIDIDQNQSLQIRKFSVGNGKVMNIEVQSARD